MSGIRIRGVFLLRRQVPVEAGDLDLRIEFDENGVFTARFVELWIEPWYGPTGCARDVFPPLLAYLRKSDVEEFTVTVTVTVTVRGRRGAATAIRHDIDWNYDFDRPGLGRRMRALSSHIRSHLALTQRSAPMSPVLARLLDELDHELTERYPTPAEIARHLPEGVDPAVFFEGFHWEGRATP